MTEKNEEWTVETNPDEKSPDLIIDQKNKTLTVDLDPLEWTIIAFIITAVAGTCSWIGVI